VARKLGTDGKDTSAPKPKRVKVWVEGPVSVTLYEVPPTVMKRLVRAIEEYEHKPKAKGKK